MRRFLDQWPVVAGFVLLVCLLGLAVNVVSAHVAVEYFTIHHPKVVESTSPWVMALIWGVMATWWFGAIAGVIVAAVNATRPRPLFIERVLRMGAVACLIQWAAMMAVELTVYLVAGAIPLAQRRPTFEHDRRLMAVAMAHMGEYVFGAILVIALIVLICRKGRSAAPAQPA